MMESKFPGVNCTSKCEVNPASRRLQEGGSVAFDYTLRKEISEADYSDDAPTDFMKVLTAAASNKPDLTSSLKASMTMIEEDKGLEVPDYVTSILVDEMELPGKLVVVDDEGKLLYLPDPEANTCSCTNGTAATGTACTSDNAAICASCASGFHLESDACEASTCICGNGIAATGTACTSHNAAICASCDAGFHLDTDACQANTCTCSNGDPVTGKACTSDGAAICGVCDLGFHLDSDACQVTTCPAHRWYDRGSGTCQNCPEGLQPSEDQSQCEEGTDFGLTEGQWGAIGGVSGVLALVSPAVMWCCKERLQRWLGCGGVKETPSEESTSVEVVVHDVVKETPSEESTSVEVVVHDTESVVPGKQ
eukprot:TRINITY_DN22262_c0_g1_i4.p1 TRINITY_DN22262_c0_g1~~TRINITY_DN22262_c0_g1_i4.p1  ORF type:complete len:366 (+),score=65.88 TRINITY_DN22262_c0_g1_i4:248-1345(+)